MAIHHDPEKAYTLTVKSNMVAVVSDGSAVPGLGDIGPSAAHALAEIVSKDEVSEEYIIPSMFDRRVPEAVASAVAEAAVKAGVARRKRPRPAVATGPR